MLLNGKNKKEQDGYDLAPCFSRLKKFESKNNPLLKVIKNIPWVMGEIKI